MLSLFCKIGTWQEITHMKVLLVGDVIGQPGRKALTNWLPDFRKNNAVDFVIVNAENASGGKGLTPPIAGELFAMGADVITLGNHTWEYKEVEQIINDERILRPANYPPGLPGHGCGLYKLPANPDQKIGVISLMGRYKMEPIDCPFRTAATILDTELAGVKTIIVDMHAELTSEKQAMGWYLDGRVSAVIGTHTHVQTADERLLPGGTAYLSDAGMTGPINSIIGMEKDLALKKFLTGTRQRMEVAKGPAVICGCILDIESANGKAEKIKRIRVVPELGIRE